MNMFRNLLSYFNKSLKRIKLVDRCLIIFMIILMTQSIYNLFFNEGILQNTNVIDIVVRTTTAAIFGYFLSSNFMGKYNNKQADCAKKVEVLDKNIIGDHNDNKQEVPVNDSKGENEVQNVSSNQQIIIATVIGVVSLIVLIIARNHNLINSTTTATISELRDFVSGSVGFLLGCPIKRDGSAR